jgi:hypothetical protein
MRTVAVSDAVLVALIVGIPIGIILLLWLMFLPGKIAAERRHASADAIDLCGKIGVLFWPCWIVALVWAHTQDNRPH